MGARIRRALDGVDLAMAPDRHLAITGESGSGESTLLRLLRRGKPPARRVLRRGAPARRARPAPVGAAGPEPFRAVDAATHVQLVALIQDLAASEACNSCWVSHDLGVIERLCHDVMMMEAATVAETGPVGRVFGDPQAELTRRLLGAIASRPGSRSAPTRWAATCWRGTSPPGCRRPPRRQGRRLRRPCPRPASSVAEAATAAPPAPAPATPLPIVISPSRTLPTAPDHRSGSAVSLARCSEWVSRARGVIADQVHRRLKSGDQQQEGWCWSPGSTSSIASEVRRR